MLKRAAMQNQPTKLQRPPLSPAMQLPGQTSSPGQLADRDRRRNRLGYHRTSVACVNCRHRKIRCQLATGEHRCIQCIRLRKSCKFQSVDQQADQERIASLSEDTNSAEMSPLTLTTSADTVASEVSASYTDYNGHHHHHHHGAMLPNGVGFQTPSSGLLPDPALHTTVTVGPVGWSPSPTYLGGAVTSVTIPGLSPYMTANDLLHSQHPLPAQHVLHSSHHEAQHTFHHVLGSNNVGAESPWAHVSAAQTPEALNAWAYPPPSM